MILSFYTFVLLGIIIVLLQSYIKLNNKYKALRDEHDYMSRHIVEIYQGISRINKASKKAVAPIRAKKLPAKSRQTPKKNLK